MAAGILAYNERERALQSLGIHRYCAVSPCPTSSRRTCQYEALKYVSFPVQTLGKCAKMIPVMIWGYSDQPEDGTACRDVGIAIAAGVTARLHDVWLCTATSLRARTRTSRGKARTCRKRQHVRRRVDARDTSVFDGFTSTFQDKLFRGYQMETYNQMLWVNFMLGDYSCVWLYSDRRLSDAMAFIERHPAVVAIS